MVTLNDLERQDLIALILRYFTDSFGGRLYVTVVEDRPDLAYMSADASHELLVKSGSVG